MENVNELIKEIRTNVEKTRKSASSQDEVKVMRAMLNDKEYKVSEYRGTGKVSEFCPSEKIRDFSASVISNAVDMSQSEANAIMENYEYSNKESQLLIDVSKEFINTYLDTGRKISLGGRADSNISLIQKEIPETKTTYPKKVGEDKSGNPIYAHPESVIPAHKSISVSGSCPKWVKND